MSAEAEAVHGAAEAVEASGGISALGLNVKIFIAQLINFTIVILVFWKWIYKPIVKMLDERAEKIETSMKQAKEIEERLSSAEEERKRIVKEALAESAQIVEQAEAKAESRGREIAEATKTEVKGILTKGKKQLAEEKQAMMKEARSDMADILSSAAESIIKSKIDEKQAHKLVADAIDELDKSKE